MSDTNSTNSIDIWALIHNDIQRVSKQKFIDGHYADAVESALKEVNTRVKKIVRDKTGRELDGAKLMEFALSPNSPIIVLDDLSTESGRSTQRGYHKIFPGAMTGIRNQKAHENVDTSKEKAIHFIFLASLLMIKIDDSRSFFF